MQEFRSFVEEGGVVFIAFDDEMTPAAQLETAIKVFGNAPNEERWLTLSNFENPGQHGSRRSLAVRARDHDYFFTFQEFVMQQLRQRAERNTLIEDMLKFDVAARDSVADHYEVWFRFQILGSERLRHLDSHRMQKIRHRGIRG